MSEQRKPTDEYVIIRHQPGYRLRRAVILVVFTVIAAAAGYAAGLPVRKPPMSNWRLKLRRWKRTIVKPGSNWSILNVAN